MKIAGLIVGLLALLMGLVAIVVIQGSHEPPHPPSPQAAYDEEIERQAELCKNGHMEACDTERALAKLKQAAGK